MAEFVAKCLICQQIMTEHQAPVGKLQPLPIPVWKWERITMDFVTALSKTQRKHDYMGDCGSTYEVSSFYSNPEGHFIGLAGY